MFGDGPRRPLSADERRIWRTRADAEFRAGRLTLSHLFIAEALLKRLGKDGRCDPSHATLAKDAARSPSSVLRALHALQDVGLLTWERRLERHEGSAGRFGENRVKQTSNAYALLLPDRRIAPRQERPRSAAQHRSNCDRQKDGETPYQIIQRSLSDITEAELEAVRAKSKAHQDEVAAGLLARQAERWRKWGWLGPQAGTDGSVADKPDG